MLLTLTTEQACAVIAVMEELLDAEPASGRWLRDRLRDQDPIEEAHFTCFENADVVVSARLTIPVPRWPASEEEQARLDEARARLAVLRAEFERGPVPAPAPLGPRLRPSPLAGRDQRRTLHS